MRGRIGADPTTRFVVLDPVLTSLAAWRHAGRFVLLGSVHAFPLSLAAAQVEPAALFGSHMVIQRESEAPVWGTTVPGGTVDLEFRGATVTTTADGRGRWRVQVATGVAGGPFRLTLRGGDKVTVLDDVLVGDVWLCSGQSNMEWPVRRCANADAELARADAAVIRAGIRCFRVAHEVAKKGRAAVEGLWQVASSDTVGDWSGVALFFAQRVRRDLNVPIGIVQSTWGGTAAEAWTSPEALAAEAALPRYSDLWEARVQRAADRHARQQVEWSVAEAAARRSGQPAPAPPQAPLDALHRSRPGGLFHGMVAPLLGLSLRGVLWYQGEANAARALEYRALFPTLIRDWRRRFGRANLPFLFVQLPGFRRETLHPRAWAELRESQAMALSLPGTAMAVTIDIGDPDDIHPQNKPEVGRRLALLALDRVYGHGVAPGSCSPMLRQVAVAEDRAAMVVSWDHVGGGLRIRAGGSQLLGFELAGADQRFVPATAQIDGTDSVVVTAAEIAEPVAVRYAFRDVPVANLVNSAGLPAAPFRSDDWPRKPLKHR